MSNTINFTGTGGIIEGNLGAANVNVNLDPVYGNFNADTSALSSTSNDFDNIFDSAGGSASAWVYPKSLGENNQGHLFNTDTSGNGWKVYLGSESGGLCRIYFSIQFSTTDGIWYTDRVLPLNAWSHVAVTYDSDDVANNPILYLNGVALSLTESSTPAGTRNSDAANTFFIGNTAGINRTWDGYIMDAKVYKNVAVTETNVKKMASKINVDKDAPDMPTSGIQLWAKLNTSTTADSSGESNTLTAANMGSVVYDEFIVDVYDNSTTTDGTFTVTQGKVEGKALTSLAFDGTDDHVDLASSFTMSHDGSSIAFWVKKDNATGNQDTIIGQASDANQHWIKINTNGEVVLRDYPTDLGTSSQLADTNWNHVVITMSGDSNGAIYFNGVSQPLANNDVVNDPIFDHFGSRGTTDPFDGKLRDVKVFDYALSAEQAASLYSGTYVQTPKHHWKLDEGTGTAVEDYGTGTDSDGTIDGATYSNGTLDLDGDVTIAANGTLSAPRGNIEFSTAGTANIWDDNSTNGFIGNGGSLVFIGGGNKDFYGNGGTGYANIVSDGGNSNIRWREDATCTGITINSGGFLTPKGDNFTITCTGNIVNNGTWKFSDNSSNGVTVAGASATSPAVCSGNEWNFNSESTASICLLKDLDFQFDIDTGNATGAGAVTLRLTGDCEFDAVTVSSGDTLDLNGQRAVFSGAFDLNGSLDLDGSMAIFKHTLDLGGKYPSGGLESDADTVIIHDPPSTSEKAITSLYAQGTFFAKGAESEVTGYSWGGGTTQQPTNIFVGGQLDCQQNVTSTENITVATGGELRGVDRTLTVGGDFTTSGGLIGKSALHLNGSDQIVTVSDSSSMDAIATNDELTVEAWVNADDLSSSIADKSVIGRNAQFNINFESSNDKIEWLVYIGGGFQTLSSNTLYTSLTAGKYIHVAGTWDGTTMKLYIDGKLDAQSTPSGSMSDVSTDILIGGYRAGNEKHWDGIISKCSVWSKALTEAQIRTQMFYDYTAINADDTNFNDTLMGKLVGWWQFDEGTGTSTLDSTSNDNDGTLSSAAWAGAGTFTYGTSTLNFTKSGTAVFNFLDDEDIYNLTIGTGNTLRLECLDENAGRLDLFGTLNMTGTKITTGVTSGNSSLSFSGTGDRTNVINNPSTALADLYTVSMLQSSDTITMPAVTVKRLTCNGAGTTLLSGALVVNTGHLQVQAGTLNTSSSDHAITCAGDCKITGTLTLNGSAVTVGALQALSGAAITQDSDGTIEITAGSTFGGSDSYSFKNDDGTSDINLGGTLTQSGGTYFHPKTAPTYASVINNVVGNAAAYWVGKVTIGGNYTLNAGDKWQTYGGSDSFIVNGDVLLNGHFSATSGTLAAGSTGEIKFGGLKMTSGSQYTATPLTTTITNRYTGESHLWKNDGGTYTHNNGTVKFNDNDHSKVKENTFYNVEVESNLGDYAVSFEAQGGGGNPFTILGDLTITRGDFELYNANDTCDIHGKTIINGSSNSGARFNNDKNQTATITHHGPVEIYTGTYHVEDGGSVKILGGFRNIGGLVD